MSFPPSSKAPDTSIHPRVRFVSPSVLTVTTLLSTIFVFYYRLWVPDLVLIKRDAFKYFLPLKQYLAERLSAGELPQWFPYEAMGRPFIAVVNTGVFHPSTALYLLFSVSNAYRISTLLSYLLAALGAYVLGRRLGLSYAGSLLAGITFTLSGYLVSLSDSVNYLYSICLIPFFCASLDRSLAESPGWTAVPAALWASVFLMGDVQTGYYYLFLAVLWTAARARGNCLAALGRLALIGLLALLLAGIQLGPAWATFEESDRTQPALFREQALHWSTHPLRLITVLASPVGEYKDLTEIGR